MAKNISRLQLENENQLQLPCFSIKLAKFPLLSMANTKWLKTLATIKNLIRANFKLL